MDLGVGSLHIGCVPIDSYEDPSLIPGWEDFEMHWDLLLTWWNVERKGWLKPDALESVSAFLFQRLVRGKTCCDLVWKRNYPHVEDKDHTYLEHRYGPSKCRECRHRELDPMVPRIRYRNGKISCVSHVPRTVLEQLFAYKDIFVNVKV